MSTVQFTPGKILIKNLTINFIGMVIPLCAGVVALPLAIKGLGSDAFGILMIAWTILSYLTLLDFGLSRSSTKYTAENLKTGNQKNIPSIFYTSITLSFGFGCLSCILLILFKPLLINSILNIPVNYISETNRSFYFIALSLPFILISISLKGMLGAAQRFDLVNLINVPVTTLNFIFPALALPFNLSLSDVILGILISRVLSTLIFFILCIKIFSISLKKPVIQTNILKMLLTYGGWITITSIISPILVYLDRFFIGSLLTMKDLTYYSAPLEAILRLRILPLAIMTTLFPEFSIGLGHQNQERLYLLFTKSFKLILISAGIIAILIFSFSHDILYIWLGNEFVKNCKVVLQIFSLSIFINFLALIPFHFLQGIGRPDLPAKFHLIEFFIYIPLIYIFTKKFGIQGSAIAWLIRVTLDSLLLYKWTFKFLPNLSNTLKTINLKKLLGILVCFLMLIYPLSYSHIPLIFKILLLIFVLILTGYLIWKTVLDHAEKKALTSIIQKLNSKNIPVDELE